MKQPDGLLNQFLPLFALVLVFGATAGQAQTVSTIINFKGTNGSNPFGSLAQGRDGKLYGTTYVGGANGLGTIFRINPATGFESVLHNFDGTNGSYPGASVTLASDGNYYGTTAFGGSGSRGVLYKVSSAGVYTVLHQFMGGSDGGYPYGSPIEASDGNLYGVTSGGTAEGSTLYKYTRSGVYSSVYTYDFATSGWLIYGLIQGSDGLLYTIANIGGSFGCGAIAKLTLSGVLKQTHGFDCSHGGANPVAPLIQGSDGNYYGTTRNGGTNGVGVIFKLSPAFGETVLYNFVSGISSQPQGGLVQGTDGNLYGTTLSDELYSWNSTSGYTSLATLAPGSSLSTGLTQSTSGLFYGPSWKGGTRDDGYIYSLDMGLGPFVTFVRAQGKVGSTAEVLGQGLTGTTSVTFNGTAASFTVVSDNYLTAVVPAGAATGPVVVITPGGILTSNKSFKITQ